VAVNSGLRVLVCDDHAVLADALASYLRGVPGMGPVDVAYNGEDAIRKARAGETDLLVLDLGLGEECDGLAVVEAVQHLGLTVRILLLSGSDDGPTIARGLQLGAHGFCGKDSEPEQLVAAIGRVSEGQVSLPGRLIEPVLRELEDRRQQAEGVAERVGRLTPREQQVLRLLSSGRGTSDIARALSLSTNTVRTHLQHIMSKLGVHNQLQAAAEGRKLFGDPLASTGTA
jgi:DNA-binding NarL/FixJ family response regulator